MLEPVCCKKRPWSSRISLVPFRTFRGPLFPKTSNWSGTIFCRFLQQTGEAEFFFTAIKSFSPTHQKSWQNHHFKRHYKLSFATLLKPSTSIFYTSSLFFLKESFKDSLYWILSKPIKYICISIFSDEPELEFSSSSRAMKIPSRDTSIFELKPSWHYAHSN